MPPAHTNIARAVSIMRLRRSRPMTRIFVRVHFSEDSFQRYLVILIPKKLSMYVSALSFIFTMS